MGTLFFWRGTQLNHLRDNKSCVCFFGISILTKNILTNEKYCRKMILYDKFDKK